MNPKEEDVENKQFEFFILSFVIVHCNDPALSYVT